MDLGEILSSGFEGPPQRRRAQRPWRWNSARARRPHEGGQSSIPAARRAATASSKRGPAAPAASTVAMSGEQTPKRAAVGEGLEATTTI